MSSTSIRNGLVVRAGPRDRRDAGAGIAGGDRADHPEPQLLEMLSLAGWRKLALETLVSLAAMTVLQRWLAGVAEFPGLPHPYWFPVLLASCQYGMSGGMFAAVTASVVYWFELSPPSAAQDFYAYAGMVAVQPAVWLATALVIGGLRSLHIHQSAELAEQLAACRRRADDLSGGLEQAAAEINALERRIAVDMNSVASLSRSFSLIDLSDRLATAVSCGGLFRVGTGAATLTIYLNEPEGYVPVWAVEDGTTRSTKSMALLHPAVIDAMTAENPGHGATGDVAESEPRTGRYVVRVPPADVGSEALAVIVCNLPSSLVARQVLRRADELSRAFATMLRACPNPPLEGRR